MSAISTGDSPDLQPLRHAALRLSQLATQHGDPSLEQESRQLLAATRALREQLEAEELVAAMSNRLLNLPLDELQQGIGDALGELGRLTQVDRVYVFLLTEDGTALHDAQEWVSAGTQGHDFSNFRGVPVSTFPWSMERFARGETIYVDEPDALPQMAAAERGACEALDISAYVNMPMLGHGQLIGWLGFDSVGDKKRSWSPEQLAMMRLACDVLCNAIGRKRRDQALFRDQELRERMVSLGTLSAGLAHEMNNPLSFALGNVQYLREITPQPDDDAAPWHQELAPVLEEVETGLERMSTIVADLRAFLSRPDDDSESVDLREVVQTAARIVGSSVRRCARLEIDLGSHSQVKGTLARLSQVFISLLLNAAKAIPTAEPDRHLVTIRSRNRAQEVEIEVSDTGVGIPPDQLAHIFDPFFTTRRVGEGMGLGLSVCHHIVSSVGGRISVTSEEGRGTTFHVHLRRAVFDRNTQEIPRLHDAGLPNTQVLIVDDEPIVLKMLTRMLRGHHIHVANSGHEAQAAMKRERFAVVLCDVMMPDITGLDLFQWAQREDQNPEGFVFMSGGVLTEQIRQSLDQTHRPLLLKPFDIAKLKGVVREQIQQVQAAS